MKRLIAICLFLSGAVAQQELNEAQRLFEQAKQQAPMGSIDLTPWRLAVDAAEKAVLAAPQDANSLHLRAEVYFSIHFWDRAEKALYAYFAIAGDRDPDARLMMAETEFNLGYSAYERGELSIANQKFTASSQFAPTSLKTYVWQARTLLELGDPVAALPVWQKAADLAPDDKIVRYFLTLTQQSKQFGSEAVANFSLGYKAFEEKKINEALIAFRESVKISPNFLEAWRLIARITLENNLAPEAVQAWEKIIEIEGANNSNTYFLSYAKEVNAFGLEATKSYRQGYDLYTKKDISGAEAAFAKAVFLNPNFQKAWSWLGRVRFEQNNYAGAIEAYTQAVQIDLNDKSSAYFLKLAQSKR